MMKNVIEKNPVWNTQTIAELGTQNYLDCSKCYWLCNEGGLEIKAIFSIGTYIERKNFLSIKKIDWEYN